MAIRWLAIIAFFGGYFPLMAQISDNFSDGNFEQNPVWQGDAANFTVNAAGELQLNASVAGASVLAVQGDIPNAAVWDFRFRLGFSPSNQNLLRIYLQSDQAALNDGNGYFIEIGETGSNDALRLFRQDAGVKTQLGAGVAGLVAVNPDIRVVVTRTFNGAWTVEAASGTGALSPQISVSDATHSGGPNRFFGIQCVYTVSNINRFYFDDLQISAGAPDTLPPVLLSAQAIDANQVLVTFDEPLDTGSAENTASYLIDNGIGAPSAAVLQPNGQTVQLTLANPLFSGNFTVQTIGIADLSGNISAEQNAAFSFVVVATPQPFDILINEIMADPTPSQGLPELEWMELLNRSATAFDLAQLRIKDAGGPFITLPSYILEPGAYVALVSAVNANTLQAATTGPVLGIAVSGTILNNDGDDITLANASGLVIDQVSYDIDWHTVPSKRDGGWSLERINPNLPCLGSDNWQSCPLTPGGTPGLANASLSTAPDLDPPNLLDAQVESAVSVLLTFSEGLDQATATDPAAFSCIPAIPIAAVAPLADNRAQLRLQFATPLQSGVFYGLRCTGPITDCSGNAVPEGDIVFFGLAETAERYDVVITEIMPKPAPSVGLPVAEWFELLNRSGKIIDLASLRIQDQSGSPATLPTYLIPPGQYVAVTAAPNVPALSISGIGPLRGGPFSVSLMNDDSDVLLLTNTDGNVIDRVAYTSAWHTEPGKKDGGWSLERINPNLPCLGADNWQSCPNLPGGTPGKRNASDANTTDDKAPHLWWAYPESANTVLLTFSEGLDGAAAATASAYTFDPPLEVAEATLSANPAQVRLSLEQALAPGVVYRLIPGPPLSDCAGNSITDLDTVLVGLPQRPEPADLVVNEIMFNPATGQPRYVEFYNASGKVFDWSEFYIADFSDGAAVRQVTQSRLALPGQFHVFTIDPTKVREQFANIIQRNVMENELPTLDERAGNVTLYWSIGGDTVVLDAVDYSDDWHNGLLSVGDRDGVALERIRVESQSNNPGNWTSAASNVTGAPGTPTLPNSQRLMSYNPADELISIDPARLSPDDDGREDFLDIRYQLPEVGYAATITIFDSDGIPVKKLARQELLGTAGALRWDGDQENGSRARPGIYILMVELFSPDGAVSRSKKVCSVVR